jgi:glycine/D-amino acid oxidase-like deaminating enzyme/nitrite reductase/ring-hydroxylating ferredoxin subunit
MSEDSFLGKDASVWVDTTPDTDYPSLEKDLSVDVAVIGAGIAGITSALMLKSAGLSVALIEAERAAKSVSGRTTAEVTSQHKLIYKYLLSNFGEVDAQLYAEANQAALRQVEDFIEDLDIFCDYHKVSTYVFTESEKELQRIQDEVGALMKLGLPVEFTDSTDLPFPVKGSLKFSGQGRFHPRKYLLGLLKAFAGGDCLVFENTKALNVADGKECKVKTPKGIVSAYKVIVATHFPVYDHGLFFSRMRQMQSYVLGIKLKGRNPLTDGVYMSSPEPSYSMRSQPLGDEDLLLLSGEAHRTGDGRDAFEGHKRLAEYARTRFDVKSIDYHWTTQDNFPLDRVPYIGRSPRSKNIFIATGFAGWPMTHGTLSGMILADEILGKENPWSELYSPSRIKPLASVRNILSSGMGFTGSFVKKKLSKPRTFLGVKPGQGGIVVMDRKKVAAYRDVEGRLYAFSPVCSHLGCLIQWNKAKKTWDCPCHSSRYSYDGKILEGPAKRDLTKIEIRGN